MREQWEKDLACLIVCPRCSQKLDASEQRILSVYDHEPICMACKNAEEEKNDYESVSREAIGNCMAETELLYSDPRGYCFYHFYPFTCK